MCVYMYMICARDRGRPVPGEWAKWFTDTNGKAAWDANDNNNSNSYY